MNILNENIDFAVDQPNALNESSVLSPFVVAGWAVPPPHTQSVGIEVDVDGALRAKLVTGLPRPDVEKEFAQVTGRTETAGLTDRQALHAVLGQRQNRYLARQLCWVFTIEGLETYILQPRDPADLDLLVDAVRPTPSPLDVDVVIGVRGPIAPPACASNRRRTRRGRADGAAPISARRRAAIAVASRLGAAPSRKCRSVAPRTA